MAINQFPAPTAQPYEQTFTKSGTWTIPTGVKTAEVTVVGGGGGASADNSCHGGAGGYIKRIIDVSSDTSVAITVGAGGTPGSTTGNAVISAGGISSFGSYLAAYGGWAGPNSNAKNAAYYCNGAFGTGNSGVSEVIGTNLGGIAAGKLYPVGTWDTTTTNLQGRACDTPLGGYYLALDTDARSVHRSTDGLTWTRTANAIPVVVSTTYRIVNNGTYFIAVPTASGTAAYYSSDGLTWTSATMPSTAAWKGPVGTGTSALAFVSSSTTAALTTNGTTWTAQTLPIVATYISAANGLFFATNGTTTYYSTTGLTGSWTVCTGSVPLTSISYVNGRYVSFGSYGAIRSSSDGIAWVASTYPSTWKQHTGLNTMSRQYIIGNNIFVIVWDGITATTAGHFISTDGGLTFSDFNGWQFMVPLDTGYGTPMGSYPQGSSSAQIMQALSIGNNRYVFPWQINSATSTSAYTSTMLFSEGFTGGYTGATLSTNPSAIIASAGAFSSNQNYLSAGTTSIYGSGNLGASPEGFCKGASTRLGAQSPAFGQDYGDGGGNAGSSVKLAQPGGPGVVIVRWTA